jgi:hypothetical protein
MIIVGLKKQRHLVHKSSPQIITCPVNCLSLILKLSLKMADMKEIDTRDASI